MKYLFIVYCLTCIQLLVSAQPVTAEENQNIVLTGAQVTNPEQFYPTATMVKVNPKKISEGLRMTLGNVGYVGWEKGNLYLDRKTNEYALQFPVNIQADIKDKRQLSDKENTTSSTWYFFTYEGRPFSIDQWQ